MEARVGTAALLLAVLGSVGPLPACAPQPKPARVTSEFTEEDEALFDDGIDFVADPAGLEGPWEADWHEELEGRVAAADLIATITIETIRSDRDLDRRETIHLVADVRDEILGEAPDAQIDLTVRETQSSFRSVQGNGRRILNQPFVAFVKWREDARGNVRPRWHLAPATPSVVKQTRGLVDERREAPEQSSRRKVIIHHD
ncbi:MAG: hypothetical protein ACOCXM_01320 [Myxococcota bacterium]